MKEGQSGVPAEHRETHQNFLVRAGEAVLGFVGIGSEADTAITAASGSAVDHKPEIPKAHSSKEFREKYPGSIAPENGAEIQAAARARGEDVFF